MLASLDPDRDRAAREYENLRTRLIKFFEWRRSPFPEDLADETLERLAGRVETGEAIRNIGAFARGMAINVLRERFQRPPEIPMDVVALSDLPFHDPRVTERDKVAEVMDVERHARQRRCLERLPADDLALIRAFHSGDGHDRQQRRKDLARQLGISVNALRIRACRIRARLARCAAASLVGGAPQHT